MKARFNIWTVVVCLLLITAPALSAEIESSSSLILSGGRASLPNICDSPLVTSEGDPGMECSAYSAISRIAFNYKFNQTWGIEISGGDLGRAHGTGTSYGDSYTWQMKADGWTIAGIGHLNIGNNFSLFGKLGVIRSQFNEEAHRLFFDGWYHRVLYNGVSVTSEEKYAPTYGVGFQINLAKNLGLRFQYENFGQYDLYSKYNVTTPEKITITATSLGLVVGF